MTVETELLQFIYQLRQPLVNEFFTSITFLGSVVFVAALLVGLESINERELTKTAFWAYILNATVTYGMKLFFERARPNIEHLTQTTLPYSFPSGHTSTAFVLATVLAWRKPEARKYFYGIAVLVGISRMYLGVHFPSDIIVGALVGHASGKTVLKRDKIRNKLSDIRRNYRNT